MSLTPITLSPALPSELLTYILTHHAYPTTLLICQARADFLASLIEAVHQTPQPEIHVVPQERPSSQDPGADVPPEEPPERHPLLVPTLYQIAASRHIDIVFIPTVSHLRAYLAVFPSSSSTTTTTVESKPPHQKFDKPGKSVPFLVAYGIVELHRDTTEWSAQGLGNSLSTLVEAGRRARRRAVIIEQRIIENIDSGLDVEVDVEEGRSKAGSNRWSERVPMLNGSVRRVGLDSEDGGWSGRTVEVGRILRRWFKFRKGEWDCDQSV